MDAVVISDLHLGSPACRVDLLHSFLLHLPVLRPKKLVLCGDVLDGTSSRLGKRHWRVLSCLRQLSDEVEIIWVRGNHDADAESVAHLVGASFLGFCVFGSGNLEVSCVHGDTFDDFVSRRPFVTAMADLLYQGLQRLDLSLARFAKSSSKTFLRCCRNVQDGALSWGRRRGSDVVVCGHTHHAEEIPGIYYNSGCWTEDVCHYVTFDNGECSLCSYSGEQDTAKEKLLS